MRGMYVLDDSGLPLHTDNAALWLDWFDANSHDVAKVYVGGVEIHTIFFGIDQTAGRAAPVLFETRVDIPGEEGFSYSRYRTRQAAIAGHRLATKIIQRVLISQRQVTLDTVEECKRLQSPYSFEREIMSVYLSEGMPFHDAQMRSVCDASGYSDVKVLGDAGWVAIKPLMYTHAVISGITDLSHEGRWCYRDYASAKAALDAWDGTGEPTGWHRHPASGRRILEDGSTDVSL